jgi:hypothetical protein
MCGFERLAAALVMAMAGRAAVAGADPVPPPAPHGHDPAHPEPIQIPAALARRSATLEPSGVVWAKALDRYLIVSDDTGEENDHHQPWVLAMSRDGVFDEAVVPVLGIEAMNDAEAICPGPEDGTFFISTSHSPNRKGHTPATRRMLMLARLQGRALQVEGRVDLTTARAAAGGDLLAIAGLPVEGRLDIEALAIHGGALLIGLKSPLSARDGAVALRLASPAAAVRAGVIPPGAVTRAWEVSLAAGGEAPRGIADLATLPDGSLIVVANAPKGRAADGGGAVFWLRPGEQPRLLKWFERQRPEGVAVAADGKSLVLVFDNHERPPTWTHLPLPHAKVSR